MENITRKVGRPKGSTSKKNSMSKGGVYITNLEKQIEGSAITRKSGFNWVNWGIKNNYPNLLLDLYNQSPTHRSAINFAVQSILGNGVDFEQMKLNGDEVVPNYAQTWDEVIKSLALDYILYGSYAIQVIQNKDGKTFSFWHMPLDKVRWSEYDEDGQITSYWICNDWTMTGQYPPIQIDALDMREDFKIEKSKPYLYVYRTYSPTMNYYTQPHYAAAIKAIQAEIEYCNYDLKNIVNGFTPSGVLTLPEVETDEQRQAIINNITRMFQGSENANSVMITFRSSVEDKGVEYTPFTASQGNVNVYGEANQRVINRILESHQIPNAALIGMPDISNSGFASEADKLEVSYQLYNKLTGNYNRMAVIRTLNQMLKMNGIDTEIIMKPLSFNDFQNDADVKERTESTTVEEKEIKETNVEEQKTE
jgi:hypothetical protein